MSVQSGQRREACGTVSCKLRVPCFSVTRPCVVQAPTFASWHCARRWYCEVVRVSLGVFCYASPRRARAILVLVFFCVLCKQAFFPHLPECPATHVNVAGLLHGKIRSGHHPQIRNRLRRAVILDGAGGALDKNRRDAGTEDDGENVPAPKVSAPELANVTDVETTQKKLWAASLGTIGKGASAPHK